MQLMELSQIMGLVRLSDQEIIELAYQNKLDQANFEWQDSESFADYHRVCKQLDTTPARIHTDANFGVWLTPPPYNSLDLNNHILNMCSSQQETDRCHYELGLVQQIGAEDIFRHLIYLVHVWTEKNLVWGVGRGSSVSCFLLYKIGLNRINPLEYGLEAEEFFRIS